jgi:hypothetical protein
VTALEDATNIGPVLAEELRAAGFATLEDLRAAGYVAATRRLRSVNPSRDCANSALAIAGAIAGVRWMRIPADERRRIVAEVNAALDPPPAIT